jgi:hypothetical protein
MGGGWWMVDWLPTPHRPCGRGQKKVAGPFFAEKGPATFFDQRDAVRLVLATSGSVK